MATIFYTHAFPNGLQLLVEPVPGVESAAFTLLLPAGVMYDPVDAHGTANLLSALLTRGAGHRNSRELTNALDNLGVHHSETTEIAHTSLTATTLAKNLVPALEIVADIVRQPHLDAEQFEFCRSAALQELEALEDDPGQKTFVELRRRSLPTPLGFPILGEIADIERLTPDIVRTFHQSHFRPNSAILGVAGAVDFNQIRDVAQRIFGTWEQGAVPNVELGRRSIGQEHIVSEKVQTYIGIAFEGVSSNDPDFFNAHGAVGVLSGGMSARLFTEVREKRGLCYSVGASFMALKDRGLILAYSSSNNERASETLSVILAELRRLREGIGEDEVRRVKAGLKSSLIMQEESTSARASILARSWYTLGRVRTVEEVAMEIDRLTPSSILEYLERHPPGDFNIVTLGPTPLEIVT